MQTTVVAVARLLPVLLLMGLAALTAGCQPVGLSTPPVSPIRAENVWSQPAVLFEPDSKSTASAMQATPCPEGAECPPGEVAGHEMGHAMGSRGVVYLTLINNGDGAVRLVGGQSPVAQRVEIHETTMDAEGVMRMRPVEDGVVVAPGERVDLAPGGLHIMLIDLTQGLNIGDRFPVTLTFESGEAVTVESVVRLPE